MKGDLLIVVCIKEPEFWQNKYRRLLAFFGAFWRRTFFVSEWIGTWNALLLLVHTQTA